MLLERPRSCQHQCPIVLVHEAEGVHQLMHGHNQPVVEAARVQEEQLLPSPHTKLAGAFRTYLHTCTCTSDIFFSRSRRKGRFGYCAGCYFVHRKIMEHFARPGAIVTKLRLEGEPSSKVTQEVLLLM